jgi:hypothetical protein
LTPWSEGGEGQRLGSGGGEGKRHGWVVVHGGQRWRTAVGRTIERRWRQLGIWPELGDDGQGLNEKFAYKVGMRVNY